MLGQFLGLQVADISAHHLAGGNQSLGNQVFQVLTTVLAQIVIERCHATRRAFSLSGLAPDLAGGFPTSMVTPRSYTVAMP